MPEFEERDGMLVLPRFKMEFRTDLIQTLKAVGIRRAFDRAADFSGISLTPLFISRVEHATFVEVTEEGTEAAAATGIAVSPTAVRPVVKPFQMIVDRPFFLLIEDGTTHSILFMGVVNDPASQ
jgi:serpin B